MANQVPRSMSHSFVETLSLSADGSGSLTSDSFGCYLVQVEVSASADDAITLTLNTETGTQIGTITTSAATTGEFMALSAYRYITDTPTYTLSGLGSGTATVKLVYVT